MEDNRSPSSIAQLKTAVRMMANLTNCPSDLELVVEERLHEKFPYRPIEISYFEDDVPILRTGPIMTRRKTHRDVVDLMRFVAELRSFSPVGKISIEIIPVDAPRED